MAAVRRHTAVRCGSPSPDERRQVGGAAGCAGWKHRTKGRYLREARPFSCPVAVYSVRMNRDRHLAQVDRHIAECKTYIAQQREIIQELIQNGQDTELAVSMLHVLRASLRGFEHHRDLVIERLKDRGSL